VGGDRNLRGAGRGIGLREAHLGEPREVLVSGNVRLDEHDGRPRLLPEALRTHERAGIEQARPVGHERRPAQVAKHVTDDVPVTHRSPGPVDDGRVVEQFATRFPPQDVGARLGPGVAGPDGIHDQHRCRPDDPHGHHRSDDQRERPRHPAPHDGIMASPRRRRPRFY
jgi:hypothetical protein